jgi:hypothetical protein
MSTETTRDDVLRSALALDEEDREQVALALLESLDRDLAMFATPEWQDELARRVAAIDSGADQLQPWTNARDFLSHS